MKLHVKFLDHSFLPHLAVWVVLVICSAASLGGWYLSRMHAELEMYHQFQGESARVAVEFKERIQLYQNVLYGALGLYAASASVERSEFHSYLESVSVDKRLPGVDGVGFIANVARTNLEVFLTNTRADGAPDFQIRDPSTNSSLFVIKFMEPEARHKALLGQDVGHNYHEQRIAEKSRDLACPVISRNSNLKTSEHRSASGFIMLLPVYRNGAPTQTIKERQANCEGWVCARFLTRDFMNNILRRTATTLQVEVFDGTQPTGATLLFEADPLWRAGRPSFHPLFAESIPISLAGRVWTLRFSTKPGFEKNYSQSLSLLVGVLGGVVSVLLAGIVWSITRTRQRAVVLAQGMTTALRHSNQQLQSEIAERMRVEEDIKASRQKLEHERFLLRTLMDYLPDRIYFKDSQSRFLRTSKAQLAQFGLQDPAQAQGKTDFDFYSEEHAHQAYEDEQQIMHTGQSITKEEKETWPDGHATWALTTKLPLRDEQGKIIGSFGISHDISDRKRAEAALREAKETAELANRTKSQFLANMSHELRTPLNSVIGFANLLLKNRTGNLQPMDLNLLQRIQANGLHLLTLINEVLDLSKIEAQKLEVHLSPVPLDGLIRETVAQQEGLLRDRPVSLQCDLPAEIAPLQTDAEKLRQIIINLIGNGLKFTQKGSVTVRVSTAAQTHRPIRIDVIDTGIGIPKEKLSLIFEAFEQADTSTARKYGGTGLGLTISRALCRLLGYELQVSSKEGEGSTFSVLLTPPRSL